MNKEALKLSLNSSEIKTSSKCVETGSNINGVMTYMQHIVTKKILSEKIPVGNKKPKIMV